MQKRLASLRFRDLVETNVLYYDKSHEDILKKIAGSLNITYFPEIGGENLFKYKDDKFKRNIIDCAIRLDALKPCSIYPNESSNLPSLEFSSLSVQEGGKQSGTFLLLIL